MLTQEQESLVNAAFRPHIPIDDPSDFSGRENERERVRDALAVPGLHLVVYGERGCGKTSLAYVSTNGVERVKVFCEQNSDFNQLMRTAALQIQKSDPERLVFDAQRNTLRVAGTALSLGNMTGNDLLFIIPDNKPLCIILDELDRVRDTDAISAVAELVKNAATNKPLLTLVMVGVAATAGAVLRGHASNHRAIRELQLDRMQEDELDGILRHGEKVLEPLGLKFSEEATSEILRLCDRMPYYLHLMANNAAKAALKVGSPIVETEDLVRGCIAAASDADQQLREIYELAIRSSNGSRLHQRVIWGMANLTAKNNNIAEVVEEAAKIAIGRPLGAPSRKAVGSALRGLILPSRAQILTRAGHGNYTFTSPLMKGFIRLIRQGQ
ncbi:AAA family ATPase [Luteolibacter luteus]|uniref:ATP-binding protein n=1 Tax=Luteolibacter luteus TaxID=2728835 RepID=A0A858RMC8_9BACT|nr:ATP-binding protein [Luteolibacter luteus]QJE97865.1 ATP-binding protein [Luteolibacter luteus]